MDKLIFFSPVSQDFHTFCETDIFDSWQTLNLEWLHTFGLISAAATKCIWTQAGNIQS